MKNKPTVFIIGFLACLFFMHPMFPQSKKVSGKTQKVISIPWAKTYYFSSSTGNDSYSPEQARHRETPWQSIEKLNSIMGLLQGGDSILLKRGDTFPGTVVFTKSGWNRDMRIVLGAYGNGNAPVITGFVPIRKWKQIKKNIWQAACPGYDTVSNVLINGHQQPLGRYPNTGYLKIAGHRGKQQILPAKELKQDWTGAEVVVRDRRWILDRAVIYAQEDSTLSISSSLTYEPIDGFGFFIQRHINTLDQDGEWYYDPKDQQLYIYFNDDPNKQTCLISTIAELIHLQEQTGYVAIENIVLNGAAINAITMRGVSDIAIKNVSISYTGCRALDARYSRKLEFNNNAIQESNSEGICFEYCTDVRIKHNTLENIGLLAGMGLGGHHVYSAMSLSGEDYTVEDNVINNVGYLGIYFWCKKIKIFNNIISNFCRVKDDGGGIYTFANVKDFAHDQVIEGNTIIHGKGAADGTPYYNPFATGIYLDDNTSEVNIAGNTIIDCSHSGIYVRNSRDIRITGNIVGDNPTQIVYSHDTTSNTFSISGCEMYDNILLSRSQRQHAVSIATVDDLDTTLLSDRNIFYHSPLDSNCVIVEYYKKGIFTRKVFPLEDWRRSQRQDLHSLSQSFGRDFAEINSVTGDNLIQHEALPDKGGWMCWSAGNNCQIEIDNDMRSLGAGLKLSFQSITGRRESKMYAFANSFRVVKGKYYVLYFSAKASVKGLPLAVDVRSAQRPSDLLDGTAFFRLDTAVHHYHYIFKAHDNDPLARLDFEMEEGLHEAWIGNVEFYEAEIDNNNEREFLKLEVNRTATPRTIHIEEPYVLVNGTVPGDEISIPPYSSIVLLKDATCNSSSVEFNIVKRRELDSAFDYYWYGLVAFVLIIVASLFFWRRKRIYKWPGAGCLVLLIGLLTLGMWKRNYVIEGTLALSNENIVFNQRQFPVTSLNSLSFNIQGYEGQRLLPYRSSGLVASGIDNYVIIETSDGKRQTCQFQLKSFDDLNRIKEVINCWKHKIPGVVQAHVSVDWI